MKALLGIFVTLLSIQNSQQEFQDHYYEALSSNLQEDLDKQIHVLENHSTSSLIRAYQGAIIMKRASFEAIVKNKITLFKKGNTLLEKEIKENPNNIEYLFLRLAVQEHAPPILKYNANLTTDKSSIISGFSTLSPTVQKHVLNYSESSEILSSSEL